MRTRAFGSTGVMVPVIGEGTWNIELDPPDEAKRAIARGVELGITHLDTAEMYGSGKAEKLLGEALEGIARDRVFLVSKVLPSNASKRGVIRACEASLRRLNTDYLDLYLLHWAGPHPLEDTFAAFEELVAAGKIKTYGVSNFDVSQMEQALQLAGPRKLACNQVLYHLEEREIEHRLIPWCRERGVAIVAYSPFGSTKTPWPDAGKKVLEEIGSEHGVGAHAIALAFLTREEGVFAIPKAATTAHIEMNARAGKITLSPDELARIDAVFPRKKERGELPIL